MPSCSDDFAKVTDRREPPRTAIAWGAFEDYRISGTSFSGPALGVLRGLIDQSRLADEATLDELKEKSGLSAREFREFLASLKGT